MKKTSLTGVVVMIGCGVGIAAVMCLTDDLPDCPSFANANGQSCTLDAGVTYPSVKVTTPSGQQGNT
jgi:hypothetical protein